MTGFVVFALALMFGLGFLARTTHGVLSSLAIILLWRHFTGHTYHGRPHTDATWFRRGTRALTVTGNAARWWWWPRAVRGAIRTAATAGAVAAAWGLAFHRAAAITGLEATAATGLLAAAWAAVRAFRRYRVDRDLVIPMAFLLAPLLSVPDASARKAITLKPGYAAIREGEVGSVTVPARFGLTADQRAAVEGVVIAKLPSEVEFDWRTKGRDHRVSLLASPKPPAMVRWSDSLGYLEACTPGQVFIGLDRHAKPFFGSFAIDDPHWGFSCGSGRGKSTFLMSVLAQLFHQDPAASALGIDPKITSFAPLAGVPGFRVASNPNDPAEMWKEIFAYEAMMQERLILLGQDPTLTFPISLLLLDEINQFSAMISAYWRDLKESGDPSVPPVWMKIAAVLWMGRVANCHVIAVGQRLDDKATGGIGLRDSLGFRGLAGFRTAQWDMLVGTRPRPRSQKPKGRWIYDDGQDHTWVQNVYGSDIELRDYAMFGRKNADAPSPAGATALASIDTATGTGTWVVGLEAGAVAVGLELEAFRKRRQRSPGGKIPGEIRQGNRPAWTLDMLAAWAGQDAAAAAGGRPS
jgi:hypothetical protein